MKFTNIIYIDPSAETNGNGSTPATAMNTLPAIGSLKNDTMYLIRRTDETSFLTFNGNSSNNSILRLGFVGMPLSTDARYDAMPEVAKTAWGGDTATKAQLHIPGSGSARWTFSSCYDFEMYNINFLKTSKSTNTDGSIQISGTTSQIGSVSDSYAGSYFGTCCIEKCRFAGKNEPIDDMSYTTNPSRFGENYIDMNGWFSRIIIKDNVICLTPAKDRTSETHYALFHSRVAESIIISGNKMYGTTNPSHSYWSKVPIFIVRDDDTYFRWAVSYFVNNHTYIRRCNNGDVGDAYPAVWACRGTSDSGISVYPDTLTYVKNFTYTEGNHFGTQKSLLWVDMVLDVIGSQIYADGITVELPNCWWVNRNVLRFYNYKYGDPSGTEFQYIKNVKITLADKDGIGVKQTEEVLDTAVERNQNINYCALVLAVSNVQFSNISVWNPNGNAIGCAGNVDLSIPDNDIGGGIRLSGRNRVNIKKLVTYRAKKAVIIDRGTADKSYPQTVHIGEIVADTAQTADDLISYKDNGSMLGYQVIVDKSNIPIRKAVTRLPMTEYSSSSYYDWKIGYGCCCANDGATGRFVSYGCYAWCETWATVREGSAATASLKFSNDVYKANVALGIGLEPSRIVVSPSLTSGTHRVTAYVAHNGVDVERQFWIEFITDSGVVDSRVNGTWLDDMSTWSNLSDSYIKKKFICDVVVPDGGGELSARIYFKGYAANLFLDPKFVVS